MKIKVLEKTEGCMPHVIMKGEWIDLYTANEVTLEAPFASTLHRKKSNEEMNRVRSVIFDSSIIDLGVAIKLPKGFEAMVIPRSSTFKKFGLMQSNSIGLIDNTYCGDNDVWKFPAIATKKVTIPKGTRLCQFRIQLSQKASFFQKLKWLFSSSIHLIKVDSFNNKSRGGFGTTGD